MDVIMWQFYIELKMNSNLSFKNIRLKIGGMVT